MDGKNITLIIIICVFIMMSAYFSATETAFSSLNKIRIKNLAAKGNKKAKMVMDLSEDYDRLLSTILIGNNIVNIASASLATAVFVAYFGDMGITLSTVVMTVLVLIFGEISPKSLAKEAPEKMAMMSVSILRVLLLILKPVNFLFSQWKKLLSSIFKINDDRGITEEEILTMVEEARQEGGINDQEEELIRSAIEFDDLNVVDILIPRVDILAIDINEEIDQIKKKFDESMYSRLPVYGDSIDNVVGILHQRDFNSVNNLEDVDISELMNEPIFVPQSMKISKLLKLLQRAKGHMAIVIDEFGGTLGLVTLEDVLEELVGEIWDEHDDIVLELENIGENRYRVDCNCKPEKLFECIGLKEETSSNTVNGWVVQLFGGIPKVGDTLDYKNINICISKTGECRVKEVIIATYEENFTKEA